MKKGQLKRNRQSVLWLFMLLTFIVFLALMWYMNFLVNTFVETEKAKIKIWVNAIERKADLVSYTDNFFQIIAEDQDRRANTIGQAFLKIATSNIGDDITFYSDIITENKTIPCILLNSKHQLSDTKNLSEEEQNELKTPDGLQFVLERDRYKMIPINYYGHDFIYLYYKESKIYTQLRAVFDDLIKSFFDEIVNNAPSIPVIVTDSTQTQILLYGNLDSSRMAQPNYYNNVLANMRDANPPIKITLGKGKFCYVFYEDSMLLKSTRYFPILLFLLLALFVFLAYVMYRNYRQNEQDRVWVGMSKETAHQLGTPISSLMAWSELLKEEKVNPEIVAEINKDIAHLETIAQRFSQIGSQPNLKSENMNIVITEFVDYFRNRTSRQVNIYMHLPENDVYANISKHLFEWVLENICKNAVDAMNGVGDIVITLTENSKFVIIDIADNGKGIDAQYQKNIFRPGFTTKERGWGLGLPLASRIINQQHNGELKLKESEINKGSTFRIKLNKE